MLAHTAGKLTKKAGCGALGIILNCALGIIS